MFCMEEVLGLDNTQEQRGNLGVDVVYLLVHRYSRPIVLMSVWTRVM